MARIRAIHKGHAWVLPFMLLVALLTGCSGGQSGDSPPIAVTAVGYVQGALDNNLNSFLLDEQTGTLSKVASAPTGALPDILAITPDGRFLFVSNSGDGTISRFQLDGGGGMRSAGPATQLEGGANAQPTALVVAPSGQFLFVGTFANAIEVFHIDAQSGDLQPLPSSPFAVASAATELALTHSGRFLYASGGNSDAIYLFAVDSVGGLALLPSSPLHTGLIPARLRLHPSDKYLFAAAYQSESDEVNKLLIYSIQDPGDLLETPTSGATTGRGVPDFTFAPNGRFLYVIALFDNNILGFTFDPATAALAPMPGSPFVDGQTPSAVAVSPQGNILAVGRINPGHVATFSIDAQTGALSPISGNLPNSGIVTGHNPNSILLVPK